MLKIIKLHTYYLCTFCCCWLTKLCLTLCDPMDYRTPVLDYLLEFAQIHVHWVSDAIYPSYPLLPLLLKASMFPSIRDFFNESALCIRWPKYWRFSFSLSPSSDYSGLISFRIDWLDLLASPTDSQVSSPAPQFESINSSALSLLYGPVCTRLEKP